MAVIKQTGSVGIVIGRVFMALSKSYLRGACKLGISGYWLPSERTIIIDILWLHVFLRYRIKNPKIKKG